MVVIIMTMVLKISHYNNFFVAYIDKNYNNDNYVNDISDDNDSNNYDAVD